MRSNQLLNTLSKLQLEDKVVFGNRDKYDYYIDLSKAIKGFHKDIKQRLESIEPDAVYFFNAQPLILFFDISQNKRDLGELYKKVWSFDNTSIIFIIEQTEIKVFNALNYIKDKKHKSLEKITLSEQEIEKRFNLWELESGNTWKWFQSNYLKTKNKKDYQKRVNKKLFSNIKKVREDLKQFELSENEANSLILRLIFIRYLIDRKIKIHDELISGKVDELNERRKSFIQLIKQPQQLNELFKILNDRFNGVLFKETDFVLSSQQAVYLSNVFSGELQAKNSLFDGFFFEIFDFSIIPVEVISGIYESLIDEEKRKLDSAVYTPSFLVDYILKDTVDEFLKTNKPEDCTVFEVAVGSGIFLVQSLRRIIEKEIELNGNEDNKAFAEKIKGFAINNLYGIDINEQALNVTCFSIYIALLDYLKPADINEYKFPELKDKNLFEANFFGKLDENKKLITADFETTINKVKPKFILGNPPWKKDKSKEHLNWVNSTNTYNKKIIGELEIAQSFLLRTKEFMQENTICSLIVTSTIFYNVSTTTKEFKTDFLTTFNLSNFFDLSPVRRLIFEKKNSPATVVTYKLSKNKDYYKNVVKHQSLKSNIFLKNFKILVVEKFDLKEILQKHFIENDWMFKAALYGNTLDYYFLKRIFNNSVNLKDHLKNHPKGAGILSGSKNDFSLYKEIFDQKYIENSQVNNFITLNVDNQKLPIDKCYLKSGKIENLYKNFQILFKEQAENESDVIISFSESLVFKKGIFGISFKTKQSIFQIYPYLISNLYTYYIYLISGSWGTSTRPQIRWKEEYLSFPIKEMEDKTQKELIKYSNKLISDFKQYYKKQSEKSDDEFKLKSTNVKKSKTPINKTALSKINELINEIYEVKEHEKDLIDYVLNVSRYQFQESKLHLFNHKVDKDKEFLEKYAEVYLKEFSEIYENEFIQVEVFPLEHFIAMNFVMKKEQPNKSIIYSENDDTESVLKTLANTLSISEIVNTSDPTKNLYIQKDIKGFEENSFYIIKPNEYKCWHRAMAWYDVSEFKEAIQKAEINELNLNAE